MHASFSQENGKRVEMFDFEKLDVEGTVVNPDDMINRVNKKLEYKNPEKIKANFNQEILIDVSNIL